MIKPRIAFFIGTFPKLSESWFQEQLLTLLNSGEVEIDLFAFKRGAEADWTPELEAKRLQQKITYLERPHNLIKRFALGIFYGLKIIFYPQLTLRLLRYYWTHPEGKDLPYLFWLGPMISVLPHYKLVHCHFGMVANRYLILRELLNLKQKLVVTFYGQDSSKYIQSKGLKVYDVLKKESDAILVMTEEMKERFIKLGFPAEKLQVHYTGLKINEYPSAIRAYQAGASFNIVSIGRLVEKKGFDDLLRAIKIVQEAYPQIVVSLIGSGEEEDKLKSLARELGVGEVVHFLGSMPYAETVTFYLSQHLMVQLSKTAANGDTDDLPFVLLEGQATGLPVITTHHVGIPDGIVDGQTGILVGEGDYVAAADAIKEFIASSVKLEQISAGARPFIKSRFSLETLNKRLVELYRSLLV